MSVVGALVFFILPKKLQECEMTLDEKESEKADDALPTASLCRHYTARSTVKLRNFLSLVKARMALPRLVALRSTFPLRDNVCPYRTVL